MISENSAKRILCFDRNFDDFENFHMIWTKDRGTSSLFFDRRVLDIQQISN